MRSNTKLLESLQDELFRSVGKLYVILDGAGIPDLLDKLYGLRPEFVCLLPGELEPGMAKVVPYLVRLERNDAFTKWVLERGWANDWGIFVASEADLDALRRHFRNFLIVYNKQGRPMFFRFFDPRALPPVLKTYASKDLQQFFGPVASFALSRETGEGVLQPHVVDGQLKETLTTLPGQGNLGAGSVLACPPYNQRQLEQHSYR